MLDRNRPIDIAGTKNRTLWKQDGVYYDPSSGQEVDPSAKPPQPPAKASVATLTCKFCGAKRDDLELMKEHLLAMHRDEVPELTPEPNIPMTAMGMKIPDGTPPSITGSLVEEPEKPEPEPGLTVTAEMTIAKLREYAEQHSIDVSKLTLKADIVKAILVAEDLKKTQAEEKTDLSE